jgi:hypothetical protein
MVHRERSEPMRTSFKSSAELEAKLRETTNPKKRKSIVRVLFNRWNHTARTLARDTSIYKAPLRPVNFGDIC